MSLQSGKPGHRAKLGTFQAFGFGNLRRMRDERGHFGLAGEGRDIVGKVKKTAGDVMGDHSLQGEGLVYQLSGKAQKLFGDAKDAIGTDSGPLLHKARRFTRERPYAAAALMGVVGLALLNALRGKR